MSESEQTIRRYLLGELSESEQSALEEKYFNDPEFFNLVLRTQSDLVDDYARDRLSSDVRARVKQSYLSNPTRARRVAFAAALASRVDQVETVTANRERPVLRGPWWQNLPALWRDHRPAMRLAITLATLLVVIGGVWFLVESRRRQKEAAQIQAENANRERLARERQRVAETPQPAKSPDQDEHLVDIPQPSPQQNRAQSVVTLALTVGGVRGSGGGAMQTLVIPQGTTRARLLLNLKDNDYSSYRVSLQKIGGAEVFSQTNLKPISTKSGASFVFTTPASKFVSGEYVLNIKGVDSNGVVDDIGKSLFRVEKQ